MRRPDSGVSGKCFPTSFLYPYLFLLITNAEAGESDRRFCIIMNKEKLELTQKQEEQIKAYIKNLLKLQQPSITFFIGSKRVEVCNMKSIQIDSLITGDYGDGYNGFVRGNADIGIIVNNNDCLSNPKSFELTIKIEGDKVVDVKDNRVNLQNKF
jgi:hypothetical protein